MIKLGIDRLLESQKLEGKRVGVVCNPASIDSRFRLASDRIVTETRAELGAIFGPQHGFQCTEQENMIETRHGRHGRLGVPIYSLYSETRMPTDAMLDGLDALVVDLQEIGCRIYTYLYTMAYCMEAAKRCRIPVYVCDRPNPIGGATEGPVLARGFESFMGLYPAPLRTGMTIGELARMFDDHYRIDCELEVLAMEGWRRDMYWEETGLPWVLPSPNVPAVDTCVVFPGMVLFEGTWLSEGRGTTRPFELVGAPGIDAERLAVTMNALQLPGVHFRPAVFEPTFHKHAKRPCGGCQIHVTDRPTFRAVLTGVALLRELRRIAPDSVAWREPPYEYEERLMPVDILAGTDVIRKAVDADADPHDVVRGFERDVAEFLRVREPFLLYR